MRHLFTMDANGDVFDAKGECVAHLSDDSHILDFLSGVRAAFDAMGRTIPGEIIRDGDWQGWEAATVKRQAKGTHRTEANGLCYVENCEGCGKLHTDV